MRMREAVPELPQPVVSRRLFHAAPTTILSATQGVFGQTVDVGMVVGHEPGIGELARELAGVHAKQIDAFPTAAVAVLELDVDEWREAGSDAARLIAFAKPRDLMGT